MEGQRDQEWPEWKRIWMALNGIGNLMMMISIFQPVFKYCVLIALIEKKFTFFYVWLMCHVKINYDEILTTLLKSAYDVHPTNRPFPNKPIDAENKLKLEKIEHFLKMIGWIVYYSFVTHLTQRH